MKFMFDMQKDTISNSFLLSLTSDKKGRIQELLKGLDFLFHFNYLIKYLANFY